MDSTKINCDTINQFITFKKETKNLKSAWLNTQLFKENRKKVIHTLIVRMIATTAQNNHLKFFISEAIKAYENSLVTVGDKKFYAYIKRTFCSNDTTINLKDVDSQKIITDPTEIAERFNQFTCVYNNLATLKTP